MTTHLPSRIRRCVILAVAIAAVLAVSTPRAELGQPAAAMDADCRGTTAAVQPLARVVNTYDGNYQCLGVRVDTKANIRAIRFETHHARGDGTNKEFSLAEIASQRGAVLDGRPGHDAVILRGHIADEAASTPLTVEFLHNGLTGEYRNCRLTLEHDAANRWHLLDGGGRRTNLIVVETWGLPIVGTVGIDTLRGVCMAPPAA